MGKRLNWHGQGQAENITGPKQLSLGIYGRWAGLCGTEDWGQSRGPWPSVNLVPNKPFELTFLGKRQPLKSGAGGMSEGQGQAETGIT